MAKKQKKAAVRLSANQPLQHQSTSSSTTLIVRLGPRGLRLNKYEQLLGRFYEPLLLQRALGSTRGEHTRRYRPGTRGGNAGSTWMTLLSYVSMTRAAMLARQLESKTALISLSIGLQ